MHRTFLLLFFTVRIFAMSNEPYTFFGLPKDIHRVILLHLQNTKDTRSALRAYGNLLCTSKRVSKLLSLEQRAKFYCQCITQSEDTMNVQWKYIHELKEKPIFAEILEITEVKKKLDELQIWHTKYLERQEFFEKCLEEGSDDPFHDYYYY